MKKLILISLLIPSLLFADNITDLMGSGLPAQTASTIDRAYSSGITADVNITTTGKTVAIQEATSASKCMGTLTANGATPVVTSTTCALTGSRIFLTRTSAETGTTDAYISAISNGVSFSVTSEAADTGTYNWIIFHEAS